MEEDEEPESASRSYTPVDSLHDNEPGPSTRPTNGKKTSKSTSRAKRKRSSSLGESETHKPRKKIRPLSPVPPPSLAATTQGASSTPPEPEYDVDDKEALDVAASLTQEEARDVLGQESQRSLPSPPLSSPSPPNPPPQRRVPERAPVRVHIEPDLSPWAMKTLELFDDFLLSIDKEAVIPSTQSQDLDTEVERPMKRPQQHPGRTRSKREERELAEVVPETDLSQSQSQPVESSQPQPADTIQSPQYIPSQNNLVQPNSRNREQDPIVLAPNSSQPETAPPLKPKRISKGKSLRPMPTLSPSAFSAHLPQADSVVPFDAEPEDEIEDFSGELNEERTAVSPRVSKRKDFQRKSGPREMYSFSDLMAKRKPAKVKAHEQSSVIGQFTQSGMETIEQPLLAHSPVNQKASLLSQPLSAISSPSNPFQPSQTTTGQDTGEHMQEDHSKTDTDPPTQPDVSGDGPRLQVDARRFEEEESTQDLLQEQRLLALTLPHASPIPEEKESPIVEVSATPDKSAVPPSQPHVDESAPMEESQRSQSNSPISPSVPQPTLPTKTSSFGPPVRFLNSKMASPQSPPRANIEALRTQYTAQLREQLVRLEHEIASANSDRDNFATLAQQTEAKIQANLAAIADARATLEATEARTAALVDDLRRDFTTRIAKMEKDLDSWKNMAEWSMRMEQNANDSLRLQAGELERLQAREAELQEELVSWIQRVSYEKTSWEEKHQKERAEWYAQRLKTQEADNVFYCEWRTGSSCGQVFDDIPVR